MTINNILTIIHKQEELYRKMQLDFAHDNIFSIGYAILKAKADALEDLSDLIFMKLKEEWRNEEKNENGETKVDTGE